MLRKRALLPFAGFAAVCLSFPLLTVAVLGWAISGPLEWFSRIATVLRVF